jgi:hypothetical protein
LQDKAICNWFRDTVFGIMTGFGRGYVAHRNWVFVIRILWNVADTTGWLSTVYFDFILDFTLSLDCCRCILLPCCLYRKKQIGTILFNLSLSHDWLCKLSSYLFNRSYTKLNILILQWPTEHNFNMLYRFIKLTSSPCLN